jgi:general stress protein 26
MPRTRSENASTRARRDAEPRHLAGDEALARVRELLEDFRSAMLTTLEDGVMRTRPMGIQGDPAEFDGTLWFFTDDRTHLTRAIEHGSQATLIFQSDDENAYLQLDGKASPSRDRARMAQLWTPVAKTWFPEGLEDPHLTLIRFEVTGGYFWDSPGGAFQVLGALAKAMVTGEPQAGGEKGELELH